ncbi:DUF6382 domain-containing protein [Vallitalea okinawensis]|uniref:DUF6382 domain-containing protein n=1 Tax=Vallitalea okinawensis TaxID=2078660 RepID=UPI000CFC9D78|nr:DUF6382 domain-containing protein [Vallitalea okinawensis]
MLSIDYSLEKLSHNDKHYMVIKDLKEEHILQYQLHMLLNNDLSYICAIEKLENNNLHTLYFDRTGLQSIETYFENKAINKKQYVNLLLDIVDILLRGEHYLLPHHQYVFDPQYVFIHEETQKPYLIFLPIKDERLVDNPLSRLISFLNQLPKSDDLLDLSFRIEEQLDQYTTIKQLKFLLQGKYNKQQRAIPALKKDVEVAIEDDGKKRIAMIIVLIQVLIICLVIFSMNLGLLGGVDITQIMAIMIIFGAIDLLFYHRYKKQVETRISNKEVLVNENGEGLVVYKEKGEYYICFTETEGVS